MIFKRERNSDHKMQGADIIRRLDTLLFKNV